MDRGGRLGLAYLVSALGALALIAILVIVSNIVAKPLGTVVAFAIGAFIISSRTEIAEEADGIGEGWLVFLGVLIAAAVPALLILA